MSAEEGVAPISCVECRRLKRKCNRRHPCDVCEKHGKTCVFPAQKASRPSKAYVKDIEDRVDQLEGLLAQYAPTVAQNLPTIDRRSRSASPKLKRRENDAPSSSLPNDPGPSQSPQLNFAADVRPPRRRSSTAIRHTQHNSTTEALEKQPRNASGYEWNERQQSTRLVNDGTASLSMEPDGEGYLGFASGATLLRILQICAGGLSLSQIGPEPPLPSVDLAGFSPTAEQMDACINAYFEYYHTQYPLVHEPTFRAQWNQVIPQPPKPRWNLLLNVVLGIGAFCSFQPMYVVDYYLERALASMSVEHLESGSLTLVQAFCLLSNLTQKRNKPNAGFVYLGIAVRMAIGLGLHRELPMWKISPFEREVRRRVWWTVYMFDSGASITFGRPILLPTEEADVNIPHNVIDRLFPPSANSVPPAAPGPTIYSNLIYQSSFHLVSHRSYNRVISSPPPSSAEILEIDSELQRWNSSLPEWMRPSPASQIYPWLHFSAHKLYWRYCNLRVILFRRAFLERAVKGLPLAPNSSVSDPSGDIYRSGQCLEAALSTIRAIHQFFETRPSNRLDVWYGLHFLFHASFVPLIALQTDHGSHAKGEWTSATNLARSVLENLSDEPLAARCLKIVNLLAPAPSPLSGNPDANVNSSSNGFGILNQADGGLWEELMANHPDWPGGEFGGVDLAQTLLPVADLATLASFWPGADWNSVQ